MRKLKFTLKNGTERIEEVNDATANAFLSTDMDCDDIGCDDCTFDKVPCSWTDELLKVEEILPSTMPVPVEENIAPPKSEVEVMLAIETLLAPLDTATAQRITNYFQDRFI